MKLWDHIKGYFPVDKMLLNIFTKGWIIVLEEHLSISSNKESKPEVFLLFLMRYIAESISSALIL